MDNMFGLPAPEDPTLRLAKAVEDLVAEIRKLIPALIETRGAVELVTSWPQRQATGQTVANGALAISPQ